MEMIASRADEVALKAKFLEFLFRTGRISRGSLVASEYQVDGATRRADLAILHKRNFIGVEVKSHYDSLARLVGQIESYLQVFDEVMVFVAVKHRHLAQRLLPPAVTLFTVNEQEEIVMVQQSEPVVATTVDAKKAAILRALPKANLMKLSGKTGRHSRRVLMDEARSLSADLLRMALLAEFEKRYSETSRAFWALVPRSKTILPGYLSVLSRYKFSVSRFPSINFREEQQSRWDRWLSDRHSSRVA